MTKEDVFSWCHARMGVPERHTICRSGKFFSKLGIIFTDINFLCL